MRKQALVEKNAILEEVSDPKSLEEDEEDERNPGKDERKTLKNSPSVVIMDMEIK